MLANNVWHDDSRMRACINRRCHFTKQTFSEEQKKRDFGMANGYHNNTAYTVGHNQI